MTNEHRKPGATRGRSTLALEGSIVAAQAGRVVWFISHDDESSRAHLAHTVELLQRRGVQYRVNSPRREIGLASRRIGYQRTQGASIMRMLEDGARAARFEHFSDERLAASVAEVSGLQLTPFEQGILDDVKAEITRRAALAAVSKQINDGAD